MKIADSKFGEPTLLPTLPVSTATIKVSVSPIEVEIPLAIMGRELILSWSSLSILL